MSEERWHINELLLRNMIATLAKEGHPRGIPYLVAGAITIMPDGVVLFHEDKLPAVMLEELNRFF